MNAIVQPLADSEFFAPASTDMVDGLIGRYRSERQRMERVVDYLAGDDFRSVVGYFESAARSRDHRGGVTPSFELEHGLAALNAHYWQQALNLTDVLDFMPTKRREEWFEQIQKMETPEFEESAVRATLGSLLAARMDFLAEKVDGIFRALSRAHVTNQPEGFSKRMILTGVTNDWGSYSRGQTGHINDLRQVIAKFMDRDEPDWNASNRVVEIARRDFRGEWLPVDGNALRIRCYKNGNAHLEVHPDMAWRLNEILAHLYPTAIPSRFRTKPKRKTKEFTLMERPLPFAVLNILHDMRPAYDFHDPDRGGRQVRAIKNSLRVDSPGSHDKYALEEAGRVLEMLGGVRQGDAAYGRFQFDYDPAPVIKEIVCTGCIPDHKSHQYYPTPEHIARDAVELAEIGPDHECLEPSAGTGNLADHIAEAGKLVCVEVSPLHCQVLESKGHNVEQADFLKWGVTRFFDRIVMNPPYSQGRWQAHVEHAATMLRPDGVLVAILPASAKGKDVLPGMSLTWSRVYENQFKGATVDVVILRAERVSA